MEGSVHFSERVMPKKPIAMRGRKALLLFPVIGPAVNIF
jgi:hypothetical protein